MKFYQSFATSNLPKTKKAVKILPTLANYNKGEITRRKGLKMNTERDKQMVKLF